MRKVMQIRRKSMGVRSFIERKISKDTWVIEGWGCYSYLVIGDEKAMMVDTGMSKASIREFAETITDLPIEVVNTHGHFDHTGGNGWFDKIYMTAFAATEAKNTFGDSSYPLDYEIDIIFEGYVFDLGGRTLEVISIPAHNAGSIALLDKENKILFSGDELEAGQVLLMLSETSTVEKHQSNMKKLKDRIMEFDYIYPAHNGTPIHNSYIDAYIENAQRIMDGIEGMKDVFSPSFPESVFPKNENFRRSEYKGSSIVYDIRRIFNN
jgi:glyoxylase-like metal-dependent hydrolase (beta-lactamase superfamily II)